MPCNSHTLHPMFVGAVVQVSGPAGCAHSGAGLGNRATSSFEAPRGRVYASCEAALRAMGQRAWETARPDAAGTIADELIALTR